MKKLIMITLLASSVFGFDVCEYDKKKVRSLSEVGKLALEEKDIYTYNRVVSRLKAKMYDLVEHCDGDEEAKRLISIIKHLSKI